MHFDNPYVSHFAGIVLVLALGKFETRMLQSEKDVNVFIAYFTSTFFHELAHYVISFILGGKPTKFKVLPTKQTYILDDRRYTRWELGYVVSTNFNWFNAFPISFAPLLLLPVAYGVYKYFFLFMDSGFTSTLLMYFIIYSLVSSSLPSITDIKLGVFHNLSFIVYSIAGFIVYKNFNQIQGVFYEIKDLVRSSIA